VFADVAKGGSIKPLRVSAKTRELQSKAAFHKKQAEGYRNSIAAIEKDMQRGTTETADSEKPVEKIAARLEDLKTQAANHRAEYDDAMLKIRGRRAIPHIKYKTHRQVFGYPKPPKAPTKSPFAPTEKPKSTKSKRKPSVAWKDKARNFSEEVAAAERQRSIEMREAESREKERQSSDPFQSKLAANRRQTRGPGDV
jgi:folylpolyglutamate synthase